MNNMDSADIMKRFRKGDTAALNAIWNTHYKALVFFAMRIIKDSLPAEDIVSETFIKLWARREHFNTSPEAKAFLYLSVRNACYDFIKLRNVHDRIHREMLYTASATTEMAGSEDHDLIYSEYIQTVYQQINTLPLKCQEIFRLFYIDQMSTHEIAGKLGLSEQTVRNQKNRAIHLLKTALAGQLSVSGMLIFLISCK